MENQSTRTTEQNETFALVGGIIALVFAVVGIVGSLIGTVCCVGWAGAVFALAGVLFAGLSLYFKRTMLGWIALGLSAAALIWMVITMLITAGLLYYEGINLPKQ